MGKQPRGEGKTGRSGVDGTGLSHQLVFWRGRAPLYAKDVERQAVGQRSANTSECTAWTLRMEVQMLGWEWTLMKEAEKNGPRARGKGELESSWNPKGSLTNQQGGGGHQWGPAA